LKTIKTRFGQFDIYDRYIVTTTVENFEISKEDLNYTLDVVEEYFGDAVWGLITNRKNNYELDLKAFGEIFKDVGLVGFAIAHEGGSPSADNSWAQESLFVHTFPVRAFDTLDSAKAWMEQLLQARN
jgi:hypothetical protein